MTYSIELANPKRKPFDEYRYEIHNGDRLVARYWHDFRADDHGIEFVDGPNESWPVGQMTDFLKGGGSQPLRLSDAAIAYLNQRIP